MKRTRLRNHYEELDDHDHDVHLETRIPARRMEPTMDAELLEGDTLASVALRFNCTVADIKRLNKIDKDFEIYARKTLRIPITPHNALVLDNNLPTVHKSGNNSPKVATNGGGMLAHASSITAAGQLLDEKLIVASVANTEYVNDVILNSKVSATLTPYTDGTNTSGAFIDDDPIPNVVLAKPRMDFSFNGSDCDMNWICLFIFILALCFAIPLIYIVYIAEEKIHHDHLMEASASHHET